MDDGEGLGNAVTFWWAGEHYRRQIRMPENSG
jgi:hypothetical protein